MSPLIWCKMCRVTVWYCVGFLFFLFGSETLAKEPDNNPVEPQFSPLQKFEFFTCPTNQTACESCHFFPNGDFTLQCLVSDLYDMFSVNFTNRPDKSSTSLGIDCPCNQSADFYRYLVKGQQTANIFKVRITNCPIPAGNITDFLSQWVNVDTVNHLYLLNCQEKNTLENVEFRGLKNLTHLELSQNHIQVLPKNIFLDLENLLEINLSDNKLSRLSQDVFKNLGALQRLYLGSNQIANIDSQTFSNLKVLKQLNMESNNLSSLPRELFKNLLRLRVLDLSRNRISDLYEDQFAGNADLEILYIRENYLTSLPGDIFSNNVQLKELNLQSNHLLANIKPGAFENLKALYKLDLSGCALSKLNRDIFSNLENLTELNLSKNNFSLFEIGVFEGLKSLRYLNLNDNHLTTLRGDVFRGLGSVKTLKIRNNQLTIIDPNAMKELLELTEIDLSGNQLKFDEGIVNPYSGNWRQSPLYNNNKLSIIDLSRNQITELFSDWRDSVNLSKLDLSDNHFKYLTLNELNGFGGSQFEFDLDLRRNQISKFKIFTDPALGFDPPSNSGQPVPYKKILRVDNNSLSCDCDTYTFALYANRSLPGVAHSWTIYASKLLCQSPPSLAGFPAMSVPADQFVCPCIGNYQPCKCSERPADKTVLLDCQRANLSDIPSRLLTNVSSGYQMQLNLASNPLAFNSTEDSAFEPFYELTHLNLSSCGLEYSAITTPGWLRQQLRFPNLRVLDLRDNKLTSVPKTVVSYWNSSSNLILYLNGNPWSCDCSIQNLYEFVVSSYTRLHDFSQMPCVDGKFFSQLTLDSICPTYSAMIRDAAIVVSILSLLFVVVILISYRSRRTFRMWLYNRGLCLTWVMNEEKDEIERPYDAFISFSHMDEDFVIQDLVPQLEQPSTGLPSYRLCLHYRDWLAGEWIPDQISRSVASSKRTIVILSENFLESLWGKLEFRTAYEQVLKDKSMRLIIVVKGNLPPKTKMDNELKEYLSLNTYLKWDDPWFWDRLRYALPHKKLEHGSGSRISQAIRDHGNLLNKTNSDNAKPKHLPPLPLMTNRESLNKHVTLPRDIELSLTPLTTDSTRTSVYPLSMN